MRDLDLEYTYQLEERFWWFRGMRRVAWSWLGKLGPTRILDAGCGTGFHLHWLADRWPRARVQGMDLSETALRFAGSRGAVPLVRASVTGLPFAPGSFDLVTSFDVISQVPTEAVPKALSEFWYVLRPGGHLFVRVPAVPWLCSSHDEELQTHTRFSLAQLTGMMQLAGFDVLHRSYVNCLLFPIVAARRLLKRVGLFSGSDVRPLPPILAFLDSWLLAALKLEAALLAGEGARLPYGLSIHMLAQKTASRM